jgi:hypothetical protein
MLHKYTENLGQINHLFNQISPGCPTEFPRKLGIIVRTWCKGKDTQINDWGLPIDYCPIERTYFHKEEYTFEIGFRRISDYPKVNISSADAIANIFQSYKFVSARQIFLVELQPQMTFLSTLKNY